MTTDPKDAEIARLRMALADTEALEMQHSAVIERLRAERDRRDAQMRAEGRKEGLGEVETKLKAMIAGFRHGLDPEGCSYDAGIRDVLDKLAAILAAAEKGE